MSNLNADAAIGMMDGAYFVSRKDILDWLNDLLCLNLTKIEQTASGAVACQVIEYVYPNSVPLHRVNWEAKSEYEFVQNYKLLQAAFTKHRVQRHVDVPKLIRAKYQDNLEFCQWLKAFFEQAAPPERENYDPVASRSKGKGGKIAKKHFATTAKQHNSKLLPTDRPRPKEAPVTEGRPGSSGSSRSIKENNTLNAGARRVVSSGRTAPATSVKSAGANSVSTTSAPVSASISREKENVLKGKNVELQNKIAELELTLNSMEKERDFYFGKLRDIEIMMQCHEENPETSDPAKLIRKVFKVLYATSDDNIEVDDDGNIIGYNNESDILDNIMDDEAEAADNQNNDVANDDQIKLEQSIQSIGISDSEDDDLLVY